MECLSAITGIPSPKTCCPEECAKARQSAARCKSSRTARNRIKCRRRKRWKPAPPPRRIPIRRRCSCPQAYRQPGTALLKPAGRRCLQSRSRRLSASDSQISPFTSTKRKPPGQRASGADNGRSIRGPDCRPDSLQSLVRARRNLIERRARNGMIGPELDS
jgi:hypothetical protein